MRKLAFSIILIFAAALMTTLVACADNGGDDIGGDDEAFFVTDGVVFGFGSGTSEDRGFYLYDELDFNSVLLKSFVKTDKTVFDVYFESEKVGSYEYAGRFPKYRFEKTGDYTVKISTVNRNTDSELKGEFSF